VSACTYPKAINTPKTTETVNTQSAYCRNSRTYGVTRKLSTQVKYRSRHKMTGSVGTCHHSPSTGTDTTVLTDICVARRVGEARLFFPQHLMRHVGMHLYGQG